MSITPNQSFLVKQMQYRLAAALGTILWDLGCDCIGGHVYDKDPNHNVWAPTGWRKSHQKLYLKPAYTHHGGNVSVEFHNARFDPEHGQMLYGTKKLAQNVQVNDDGKTKVITNDSDSPVSVHYEESESVTNAFSSSITKGVSLDMTSETTAEASVSGEYMGVTAEASLSETFGISKSESKEETKDASEEGTKSEALSIEFDAEPRCHYLLTISKNHATSYQPFSIHGVMDFDIELRMPKYSSGKHSHYYPGSHVRVVGFDGLAQFMAGYDTDYPKMRGFLDNAYTGTKEAWAWLQDLSHRIIDVEGTSQASLEGDAQYHIEKLGDNIPSHFSDLPQVNASDL